MSLIAKCPLQALLVLVAVLAAVVVSCAETQESADPPSPVVAAPTAQASDPVLLRHWRLSVSGWFGRKLRQLLRTNLGTIQRPDPASAREPRIPQ